MANPQLLPQEKIVKLPIKRIKVNKGDEIPAYYDEANGIVYIKKSDGEFGWAYVRSDSGVEVAPKAAETDEKGASGGESEKKSEEPAKKHEKKPKQKKEKVKVREDDGPSSDKKTRIVAGCIIVAVVCLILVYSSGLLSVNKKPGSPSTPAPAGDNSTLNLADKAAAETYNVLIVKKNIFRGNQITEDDLAVCEISKAEFAACGGAYTSDCTSAVVGLEATKFLPFGAILTFDSCSFKTSYSESPWAKTNDNQTYLDVPYEISVKNLYDWTPGDIVALTIYVDTYCRR